MDTLTLNYQQNEEEDSPMEEEEEDDDAIPATLASSYANIKQELIDFQEVDEDEDDVPAEDPLNMDCNAEVTETLGEHETSIPGQATPTQILLPSLDTSNIRKSLSEFFGSPSCTSSLPSNITNTTETYVSHLPQPTLQAREAEVCGTTPKILTYKIVLLKGQQSSVMMTEKLNNKSQNLPWRDTIPNCQWKGSKSVAGLDVFKCFICRQEFLDHNKLLEHRTRYAHSNNVKFDENIENPFACGICGKPWLQPRQALACAIFGHDPSSIEAAMFRHNCPECPDDYLGHRSLPAVARHWVQVHPEKPVPMFFLKDFESKGLPSIKVGNREMNRVSETMLKESVLPLVLENFPTALYAAPVKVRKPKSRTRIGIGRRGRRPRSFTNRPSESSPEDTKRLRQLLPKPIITNTEDSTHLHITELTEPIIFNIDNQQSVPHTKNGAASSLETPLSKQWNCNICGNMYPSKRSLHHHLIKTVGLCSRKGTYEELNPFKCTECDVRCGTLASFLCHRTKHRIPLNTPLDYPFACRVCKWPTYLQRAAILCELYGHDPVPIREMFRFKCHLCPHEFGFHSNFALRKHWEREHPDIDMPRQVKAAVTDKPFPKVTIPLEHVKRFIEKMSYLDITTVSSMDQKELEIQFMNCQKVETEEALEFEDVSRNFVMRENDHINAAETHIPEAGELITNTIMKEKEPYELESLERMVECEPVNPADIIDIEDHVVVIKQEVHEPDNNDYGEDARTREIDPSPSETFMISKQQNKSEKNILGTNLVKATRLRNRKVDAPATSTLRSRRGREAHVGLKYPCPECNEKFGSFKNLRAHQQKFMHNVPLRVKLRSSQRGTY